MNDFEKIGDGENKTEMEREKNKMYDLPDDDPVIKEVQNNIAEIANKDVQRVGDRLGSGWLEDSFKRVTIQQWDYFLAAYPEKAALYRNKFEPIKSAFERREKGQPNNVSGQEKEGLSQKERELQLKITGTKDFRDFWRVIQDNGGIDGSQKHYEPSEISSLVARVANGDDPRLLTSKFGLRQKVLDLIKVEKLREGLKKKQ